MIFAQVEEVVLFCLELLVSDALVWDAEEVEPLVVLLALPLEHHKTYHHQLYCTDFPHTFSPLLGDRTGMGRKVSRWVW